MDNKYQIIHIVSEVVVLAGLFFYINTKNKKLINRINELTQRLEEQEDIIQKHENMILKLISVVDDLNNNLQQPETILNRTQNNIKKKHKNDLGKVMTPKKHIIINIENQVKPEKKSQEIQDNDDEEDEDLSKKLGSIYMKEKQIDEDINENLDEELEEELEKVMDEELEEELKDLE